MPGRAEIGEIPSPKRKRKCLILLAREIAQRRVFLSVKTGRKPRGTRR